jgi:hypothetical protein
MVTPLFRFSSGSSGYYTSFVFAFRINHKINASNPSQSLTAFLPGRVPFGIVTAFNSERVKKGQRGGIKTYPVFGKVFHSLVWIPYYFPLFHECNCNTLLYNLSRDILKVFTWSGAWGSLFYRFGTGGLLAGAGRIFGTASYW